MKNISQHEEFVMRTLHAKLYLSDNEGKKHPVPVIYGNADKVEEWMTNPAKGKGETHGKAAEAIDRVRLPLVGLTLVEAGYSKLIFAGIIYTLFRRDLNDLIGQCWDIQDECDLRQRISFGNFKIEGDKIHKFYAQFACDLPRSPITVSKANFTFSYEL